MEPVTRYYWFGASLAVAVMLTACGGGANGGGLGSSGVTPSTRVGGATTAGSVTVSRTTLDTVDAHKKKGKARIMIMIPPHDFRFTPLPLGKRNPKYISASTQSMTVVVAGVPTQTFNLTPTSAGCSTSGGSVSCSETAFFPTGQQTVTITLYDGQNGAGNQLSTASTSVTVASGAVTNVSITLDGVVASAKVLLNGSGGDSIPEGTATSVPASVTAYDADDNVIMSPGNYSSPVTLTNSDTSGATRLNTTSVTAPGAAITLSYNGGSISSATITPSVNGTSQPAGAAILTVASTVTPTPSPTPSPSIVEYSIPTSSSEPDGIAMGSDGALWFTESIGNKIGRIATGGTIVEYSIPTSGSEPDGIAMGSDGALWFTESIGNKIGRIATGGTIVEYSIPTSGSEPSGIVAGPDGALWFTEESGNKIGRIAIGGTIVEYPIPTIVSLPSGISVGSDGALWFTEVSGNKIGRISTSGTIVEYPIPTQFSFPIGIAAGSDGALWFTEFNTRKIGRATTGGAITEYSSMSTGSPSSIAGGPDGALWFTDSGGEIGRMTTGGMLVEYSIPTSNSEPSGIAAGPDEALWFTESGGNKIGRIPVAIATPSERRNRVPIKITQDRR